MKNAENLFIALGVIVALVVGAYVSLPYEMPEDSLGADPPNCSTKVKSYTCVDKVAGKKCDLGFADYDLESSYKNRVPMDVYFSYCTGDSYCYPQINIRFSADCVIVD